jgi:hypothetical protein
MLQLNDSAEALFPPVPRKRGRDGDAIRIRPAPGPEGEPTVTFQVVDQPNTSDARAEVARSRNLRLPRADRATGGGHPGRPGRRTGGPCSSS